MEKRNKVSKGDVIQDDLTCSHRDSFGQAYHIHNLQHQLGDRGGLSYMGFSHII